MSNFPIQCMICMETCKGDDAYLQHMQVKHEGKTAVQQKTIEQNVPKEIPLNKDAPPPPEFMELAKMMDQPKQDPRPVRQSTPPVIAEVGKASGTTVQEEKKEPKEIRLEYQYSGDCHKCLQPIKTIMLEAQKGLYAIAYCTNDNMELKQIQVHPIVDLKTWEPTPNPELHTHEKFELTNDNHEEHLRLNAEVEKRLMEKRKEASKRYDKRRSKLLNKTPVQATL